MESRDCRTNRLHHARDPIPFADRTPSHWVVFLHQVERVATRPSITMAFTLLRDTDRTINETSSLTRTSRLDHRVALDARIDAHFSPIMTHAACVGAFTISGMIDASAMRTPSLPCTR